MKTLRKCLALGAASAALTAGAPAAAVSWILDADGNWGTAANWSTGLLPGALDDVLIDVGGPVVRTITHNSGSTTVRSIASTENLAVLGGWLRVTSDYVNSATTTVGLSGILRLDSMSTLDRLNMLGVGQLDGAGIVTVLGGGTNVSNHLQSGPGQTIYLGAVAVAGVGGTVRLDGGRTVEFRGGYTTGIVTAQWDLDFTDSDGGGLLRNAAGSLMLDQAGNGRVFASHDGAAMFENFGTYRKDKDSGVTKIETMFANAGTVEVLRGRLEIIGPLVDAGNATTLSRGAWVVQARPGSDFDLLWFDPRSGLESLATNAADITLIGIGAAQRIRTGAVFGDGPGVDISQTLRHNAAGGTLRLLDGADFAPAGSNAFANEGRVLLDGIGPGGIRSLFAPQMLVNTGEIRGVGTVQVISLLNHGGVIRADDSMATGAPLLLAARGSMEGGTLATDPGSRLRLFMTSVPTVDIIDHQGTQLFAGTPGNRIVVTTDYRNAAFGAGDAFNGVGNFVVANVQASSAGQTLNAPGLAGGDTATPTLAITARAGDAASFLVTIGNTGDETILRGAVRTAGAPLLAVTGGESFMIAAGATAQFGISTAALAPGAFGGQSVVVANNFSNVADQTLAVEGQIFRLAEAQVLAATLPQVVRVGDMAVAAISIANIALADGFSEGLVVNAATSGALGSAGPAGFILLAGQNGQVAAAVDTASAGMKSGAIDLMFGSGGEGSSGLAPIAIGGESIGFSLLVNNRAAPVFLRDGAALDFDAMLGGFVVDLGTVAQGSMLSLGGFALGNLVAGPADDLSGLVSLVSGGPWRMAGAFDIGLLGAGGRSGPFGLGFDAVSRGAYLGELAFSGRGTNFSDRIGEDRLARLFLRVAVSDAQGVVPEPGTWAMMIAGFGAVGIAARRRRKQTGGACSVC